MHVDFVLDGAVTELVGRAEGEAGLDAAAGEPDGEAAGVVIAAGAVLFGVGCAAELTTPPDERVFEQAAGFKVGEQGADGLIDGAGVVAVLDEVRVLVPCGIGATVAVGDLDVAHTALAQAAGHEALAAE